MQFLRPGSNKQNINLDQKPHDSCASITISTFEHTKTVGKMLVLACPVRKGGVNPLEDENKVGYYVLFRILYVNYNVAGD